MPEIDSEVPHHENDVLPKEGSHTTDDNKTKKGRYICPEMIDHRSNRPYYGETYSDEITPSLDYKPSTYLDHTQNGFCISNVSNLGF